MKKIIGISTAALFFALFLFQVQGVLAGKDNKNLNSPVTSPVTPTLTPPVTSPSLCKPGFGFGDKNHCHDKDVKEDKHDNDKHDNDKNEKHDNDKHDKDDNHGHR